MADKGDSIDRLKGEFFGELADQAKSDIVGSGISQTSRVSIELARHVEKKAMRPAWTENPEMVMQLFTPIFERSHICPGRGKTQCCQAGPGDACFPNWQAREDPEWYALEINKYLSLVNQRLTAVTPVAASLAADEAFELGCLFTEALIKFQWDTHAKRGKGTLDSAREGGNAKRGANPKRLNGEATAAAVDELLNGGIAKMVAYSLVGETQGVSEQTIGKEYRALKKER